MSDPQSGGLTGPVAVRLHAMVKRVRGLIIRRGILAMLAALFGTTLLVMGIQLLAPRLNEPLRWLLSLLIPLVVSLAGWWYLARPLRRPLSLERMARIVESNHPELEERLSSTVEFAGKSRGGDGTLSKQLLEALAQEAATEVVHLTPQAEFSFALVKRWMIVPGVCLGIAALGMVIWPSGTFRLFVRSVAPSAELGNLYAGRLDVKPGSIRMAAGDPLTIEMLSTDADLRPVYLVCRTKKGSTEERMTLVTETNESTLRYSLNLPEVNEAFSYRVSAGYAESDRYEVQVEARPALSKMMVSYTLPAYTGLARQSETNAAGLLRAIAGTEVVVEAVPTKALSNATLRIGSRQPVTGLMAGGTEPPLYRWTLNLSTNMAGAYTLDMVDTWGFAGVPFSGMIEVVPDEPPSVKIVAPEGESVKCKPTELVKLVAAGVDDFGVGRAELRVSVDAEAAVIYPVEGVQAAPGRPGVSLVEGVLNLSTMNLAGRRRMKIVVRVYDSRTVPFGGAQWGDSAPLMIEFDQAADSLVRQALEAQQEAVQAQVAQLVEAIHEAVSNANDIGTNVTTPSAVAAVDQVREKVDAAETIAAALAEAVENTPMAAIKPLLDNMMTNSLASASQAADTLPLTEPGKQAALADQLDAALAAASTSAEALAKTMEDLKNKMEALADLAETANQQQQLAEAAGAAAAEDASQPMPAAFKKAETAVAAAAAAAAAALESPAAGASPATPAAPAAGAPPASASSEASAASAAAGAPPASAAAAASAASAAASAASAAAGAPTASAAAAAANQAAASLAKAVGAMGASMAGSPSAGQTPSPGSPGPGLSRLGGMSSGSAYGDRGTMNDSDLASKGMMSYGGAASLEWTKAKGMARSKVGGGVSLRVPPEYKEIVGRYFEELSRAGASKGGHP